MMPELDTQQTKWLILAEPRFGSAPNASYLQLLAAFDQKWEIVQPLHQRLRSLTGNEISYLFILKNREGNRVQMITIHDDPAIRKFISENRIWVTTS
jgi:hypothetical protein